MYTTQTSAPADKLLKSRDTRLHDEWRPRSSSSSSSSGGGDGQTFTLRGRGRGEENAAPKKKHGLAVTSSVLWYLYPYRILLNTTTYCGGVWQWCTFSSGDNSVAIPNSTTTLSTPRDFGFSRWHHQSSRSAARCRELRSTRRRQQQQLTARENIRNPSAWITIFYYKIFL